MPGSLITPLFGLLLIAPADSTVSLREMVRAAFRAIERGHCLLDALYGRTSHSHAAHWNLD
jgi:hypothetical protein